MKAKAKPNSNFFLPSLIRYRILLNPNSSIRCKVLQILETNLQLFQNGWCWKMIQLLKKIRMSLIYNHLHKQFFSNIWQINRLCKQISTFKRGKNHLKACRETSESTRRQQIMKSFNLRTTFISKTKQFATCSMLCNL